MENTRTGLRETLRRGLIGSAAVAIACLGAGCDSNVGIEGTDYSAKSDRPAVSTTAATTTVTIAPAPPSTSAPAEPDPDAVAAVATVRRYLSRSIGSPVDQASGNPLVCAATPRDWDPDGTGTLTTPPLAANPAGLPRLKSFAEESIKAELPRDGYISVTASVTDRAGNTQNRTFTLKSGTEGYCIGDVSE
ncbi:MAG: hypothetical protein JWN03_8912 [Nocardia sp.]|uniref:hypothetical protein n=1 Tax=Nocardia sp. TaxID=1821 RepID=UPI0026205DBA|nr:hypothetical protein [Nocardia sp.]MCU1648637.1 hypothetical protein [Nocardia sp.]